MFKYLSIITSIISFTLFLSLFIYPKLLFVVFEISYNDSAFFMARRTAMLFLGLGVLSLLMRNIDDIKTRKSFSAGLVVIMFSLAILGSVEFLRGYAGIGIGIAVFTEFFLGLAYLKIWFTSKTV